MNTTLPADARAGQEVAFYLGARESFREEYNVKGAIFQGKVDSLNALIGDVLAYIPIKLNNKITYIEGGVVRDSYFIHVDMSWGKVLEGISLGDTLEAKRLMGEAQQAHYTFRKYERGNFLPRTNIVNGKIHAAKKRCGEDTHWNNHNGVGPDNNNIPFKTEDGKLKYELPSATNESSNIAALYHYIENHPELADNSSEAEALQDALNETKKTAYSREYWDADIKKIIANTPYPDLPDPPENFLDGLWIEVDNGGDLTVDAFKITVSSQARDVDNYVHKDLGVDHVGDFEHLTSAKLTATADGSTGAFWSLSNTIDDLLAQFSGDVICLYNNTATTNNRFIFRQYTGGVSIGSDSFHNATTNQQYWFTPSRNGTSAQNLIHDDINRSSLVDTLSFTCDTTKLRYAYAAASYNSGTTQLISYETSDFDFQEAVAVKGFRKLGRGIHKGLGRGL